MPHSALNLPLPGVEFAAMTKQASCGPSEVANMPAPHGHHVDIIFDGMHSSNMPPGLPFSWEVDVKLKRPSSAEGGLWTWSIVSYHLHVEDWHSHTRRCVIPPRKDPHKKFK